MISMFSESCEQDYLLLMRSFLALRNMIELEEENMNNQKKNEQNPH